MNDKLVTPEEIEAWKMSDGTILNKYDAIRLMDTVLLQIQQAEELYKRAFDDGAAPRRMELAMSDWKPISTAPKDGRAILLLSARQTIDAGPNGIVELPPKCHIGHWWPEGNSWVDEMCRLDGDAYTLAVTGVWSSGTGWFQPNEVTHWMPLPEPPKESK